MILHSMLFSPKCFELSNSQQVQPIQTNSLRNRINLSSESVRAAGRLTRIQVQDRVTGSNLDALLTCYQRSPCLTNRNPASSSCRISPAGSSVVRGHGLMGKLVMGAWAQAGRIVLSLAGPHAPGIVNYQVTTEATGQFTKRHNVPGLIWSCRIFV